MLRLYSPMRLLLGTLVFLITSHQLSAQITTPPVPAATTSAPILSTSITTVTPAPGTTTTVTTPTGTVNTITPNTPALASDTGSIGFTPFRIWLGTNLDILNGISASKLYAQINYALLLGKGGEDETATWMASFSYFQNKSFRSDSTGDLSAIERRLLYPYRAPVNGEVSVVQTSYTGKSLTEITRVGFHGMVGWRIPGIGNESGTIRINDINGKAKKINLFIAGRAEFYQRSTTITNSYDSIPGSRIVNVVKVADFRNQQLIRRAYDQTNVSFWGIGFPFWVLTDGIEFRLNPFIGVEGLDGGTGAYIVDFNITEKQLGLSIGGDYRGRLNGSPPSYNLYIAKSFTIKDLKDFLKFN